MLSDMEVHTVIQYNANIPIGSPGGGVGGGGGAAVMIEKVKINTKKKY